MVREQGYNPPPEVEVAPPAMPPTAPPCQRWKEIETTNGRILVQIRDSNGRPTEVLVSVEEA